MHRLGQVDSVDAFDDAFLTVAADIDLPRFGKLPVVFACQIDIAVPVGVSETAVDLADLDTLRTLLPAAGTRARALP